MDVTVLRDGFKYSLHFEKGENVGGLTKEPFRHRHTGTRIKWRPDLDVFTDIDISSEYYEEILKKQAIVNKGLCFKFKNEVSKGEFEEKDFLYENGIADYVKEIENGEGFTDIKYIECERKGRDREDKPEYKVKLSVALCFSNKTALCEYYHNSSFLEHGGSPEKATRSAMVSAIDKYLRDNNKYVKGEMVNYAYTGKTVKAYRDYVDANGKVLKTELLHTDTYKHRDTSYKCTPYVEPEIPEEPDEPDPTDPTDPTDPWDPGTDIPTEPTLPSPWE